MLDLECQLTSDAWPDSRNLIIGVAQRIMESSDTILELRVEPNSTLQKLFISYLLEAQGSLSAVTNLDLSNNNLGGSISYTFRQTLQLDMNLDVYRFSISWSRVLPSKSYFSIVFLPGDWVGSEWEPYLTAHYQLLAHAAAARPYKTEYQVLCPLKEKRITLVSHWFELASEEKVDVDAARRGLDFMFGWFMHPLTKGSYPKSMRPLVGECLPKCAKEESKKLKGPSIFWA
ncbi:hypothetical protein TSUD_138880 [Trifolium subterraneum]|uniref:Beta-glucosidase n=1 Tax=Trifolium subterraneum TaxID=3900 RepID=A0A2Z6NVD5_TRISU|nr:hypothetical protein TSUD_138880 [Trifolium subterraneum]